MIVSDTSYTQNIRPSSSSTFVPSPTKSTKKSRGTQKLTTRHLFNNAAVHQGGNKDLSITGPKFVSGCEPTNIFPPPPHHALHSTDNNYDYSSLDAYSNYNQHLLDGNNPTSIQTELSTNIILPKKGVNIQPSKKTYQQPFPSVDNKTDNNISDKSSSDLIGENNAQSDWMPMRQLFNAHKL